MSECPEFKAKHWFDTSQPGPDVSRERERGTYTPCAPTESSLLRNTGLRMGRVSNTHTDTELRRLT